MARGKSVPPLQPPQPPRADRYIDSRKDMPGGRRTTRFEGEVEDVECGNIDEVSSLLELVPGEAATNADMNGAHFSGIQDESG